MKTMEIELMASAITNFRNKNYDVARILLNKVLALNPTHSMGNEYLAYVASNLGDEDLVFKHLKIACETEDCNAEALYHLGSLCLEKRLPLLTIDYLKRSLNKAGDYFEGLHDLAIAQATLRKNHEAIKNFLKAIQLNPKSSEVFYNLGKVYDECKMHVEAIQSYDQALQINPEFSEAYFNKATALSDLYRYENALEMYSKAYQINPNMPLLQGNLILTKMKMCKWDGLKAEISSLIRSISDCQNIAEPFPLLSMSSSEAFHLDGSRQYSKLKFPRNYALGDFPKRPQQEKIKIGYYSADFQNHATAYLIAELIELHNRQQFELFAFSFGPQTKDAMRQRLRCAFDTFIEVSDMDDQEIAQLSRDLGIDIAIDLKGYTQDSRTGIFSYRAAPIQVNYLGYPGTLGTDYFDYIIADYTLIPKESQQFYSEKVVYLPNCYQSNDSKKLVSNRQFTRSECGLPDKGFVFCCFNNNHKILPETFDVWMNILKSVDKSVLWLFENNPTAAANLKKEAELRGVDPRRLVFAKRMPLADHLARHSLADLFLDTLPYNAHTTASDALWSGLPVITIKGSSFAGLVATSLLNAIGLPELVTSTAEEYEALAIRLALQPIGLKKIKEKLKINRLSTTLFNTKLFTHHIEAAYIEMYQRYQSNLPPEHIHIK